jgi:site-specific recombinase XerD
MAPERDWSWLRRVAAQIRGNIRRRKRKDLKIRSSRELFHLGLSLMEEADGTSRLAWKQAVQFRDGLLIALLAARPLRLKNLAALEFDHSLVRTGDGFRLLLSPEETKTHIFVDLPLNGPLADCVERYLHYYRPVLLGAKECPLLWITQDGRAMIPGAIYRCITRRTRKAFGVAINPHLFRDCAATSLAIDDPAHVRVATTLLGHRSLTSTTRYYNQATTVTAAGKYAQTVLALRRGPINSRDRNWRLR